MGSGANTGGASDLELRREVDEEQRKPIILAKSERASEREKLEQDFPALVKQETSGPPASSPLKEVREDGQELHNGVFSVRQREIHRSESPAAGKVLGRRNSAENKTAGARQKHPVKMIDEGQAFCDNLLEYLTDSSDFVVVGVLGLQNSGKSSILNILARGPSDKEEIFRVQTYEHQMLAEHCTSGVDVYINSRRIILLDCQPLLSASIMDRSIQLEKKFTAESSSAENTIEIQSLQMIGWMYSVCHVVVLVQDWFLDMNLMRLLQAAETLKPVTPTVSGDDQQLVREYFPYLLIVQNKCEVGDLEEEMMEEMAEIYSLVLARSRLDWRTPDKEGNEPLLVLVPDTEGERAETLAHRLPPRCSFEEAGKLLRRKLFSLKRRPLAQARLTEKTWLTLASRTWENIRNSPFYMEYSRLLP